MARTPTPKMKLPLPLDYAPMEAMTGTALPDGDGWRFEPKWDGFRCLVFRDGAGVLHDHFTHGRFRHGTRLLRWRPDKAPRQCTFGQVEGEAPAIPPGATHARASRR